MDNETNAVFVSREVHSATVPVGVVIASQFQSNGVDAPLRVVQDRSVVRVSIQDYLTLIRRLETAIRNLIATDSDTRLGSSVFQSWGLIYVEDAHGIVT